MQGVSAASRERPPGPRIPQFLTFAFYRNRLGPLQALTSRYGDVVFFRIAGSPFAILNHPDYVRDVLVTQHRRFHKGIGLERAKPLLGEGLLTSEDAHHQRQRRLLQPAFHRDRIEGYGASMVASADRAAARWAAGEHRDIAHEMAQITLAIAGKTLFDADLEQSAGAIGEAVTDALQSFPVALMPFGDHLVNWPIPPAIRFRRARARLDAVVYGLIAARRAAGAAGSDLLSILVAARDEDGGGMSDEEVRDEVMTLLLAGHETTANALTWTWYLLSQHPKVRERLDEEVRQVCAALPHVDDLAALTYTRAVLAESMRLYPPAYLVGRRALDDYAVPGTSYVLPAGTVILISQYVLHRDPRFWEAPEEFRPERWISSAPPPRYAYFPFGAGPRICIGEHFAWMEGVLVLATIARRWQLTLDPTARVATDPTITLRPKYGMRMQIAAAPL